MVVPFPQADNEKQARRLFFDDGLAAQIVFADYFPSPDAGGPYDLTATGISTGEPVVGSPTLSQVHVLSVVGVSTAAPALGTPELDEINGLSAASVSTGAPTVGSPTLGQVHILAATGISTGAPIVGTPDADEINGFTAVSISTGSPTVGTPLLGQVHALAVTGIATGAPTLGSPTLGGEEPEVVGGTSRNTPRRRVYPLQPQFLPRKPETVTVHLGAVSIAAGAPSVGAPWLVELFDTTAIDEDLMLFAA